MCDGAADKCKHCAFGHDANDARFVVDTVFLESFLAGKIDDANDARSGLE